MLYPIGMMFAIAKWCSSYDEWSLPYGKLWKKYQKGIYNEHKPEALDIGLHTDDIATVAVMSGLKWIEPALPIMYAISGYRAGIGYRNVNNCNEKNKCWNPSFFLDFTYM